MMHASTLPSRTISRSAWPRLGGWLLLGTWLAALPWTAAAARVLYVTTGTPRDTTKLLNLLRAQGHDLTVHDTASAGAPQPAANYVGQYDLLIADEIISSGNIGANWRNSPVPVITWEGFLYSGNRSAFNSDTAVAATYQSAADAAAANGGAGADAGQVVQQTAIEIIDPNHPLAAGLPAGLVDVFDPNHVPTVNPAEGNGVITFAGGPSFITGASRVAIVPGYPNGFSVFGVDAGVANADGTTTQARWVHLPWNDSQQADRVMIEPSFFLFEAAVAWALGLPQPTKIYNLQPEGGGFLDAATPVTFAVDKTTPGGSAVSEAGIKLTVNGVDVSGELTITSNGPQWAVTYAGLQPNRIYTIVASATAADGGFSARMASFDTFDPNNYTVEAEDFNFDGGRFFDNIVLCDVLGGGVEGCYFDRIGVPGIDENEINQVVSVDLPVGTEVYRFANDPNEFNRQEFTDTVQTTDTLVRQKYVDAGLFDYQVSSIVDGEWLNYTRTVPAGNYHLYARVQSSGPLRIRLDFVRGNPATADQQEPLEPVGEFVSSGTGGVFTLVPLTDSSGQNLLVVPFDGTATTMRFTAASSGYSVNFYMFVPTTEAPNVAPVVALTAPAAGAVLEEGQEVTLTAEANDPDGSLSKVEFFAGIAEPLTKIGEATAAPFSASFTPPVLGAISTYTLRVVATDDEGLSAADEITVRIVDPSIQTVTTADGAGADAELREHEDRGITSGGSGQLNTRTSGNGDRNEIVALRFDLTGFTLAELSEVTLNLVNFRDNSAREVALYGVKPGTTGASGFTTEDWDENLLTTFGDMPGLLPTDGDFLTQSINPDAVTPLGQITFANLAKGSIETFADPALTEFIRGHTGSSLVTFLLAAAPGYTSTGQARFASKEATALDGGTPSGAAGDFAPFLRFRAGVPTLAITSPAEGATLNVGVATTIRADASAAGAAIAKVEFYAGTAEPLARLGEDTAAPYEWAFTPPEPGNYTIRVIATDEAGKSGQASISVSAVTPNTLAPIGKLADIVWVSFHEADDAPSAGAAGAGFTEAPDKGYTDLLAANGYHVTRYVTTGTPDPAVLNAADLVIVSRSVSSGHYQGASATAWNNITAPMILMSGYTLRQNRQGYTTGNTMVDTTGDIRLTVSDPTHPIFAGIALTGDTMDNPFAGVVTYPTDGTTVARGISINTDPPDTDGTVLATVSAAGGGPAGGMVIAEWPAGATLTHDGGAGTDTLAGRRLVFLSGSREAEGVNSETAGLFDLAPDGARMFLNAVAYMLHPEPYEVVWVSFHAADDAPSAGAAGAGFTEAPDKGYTDLLRANGFNVTRYVTTGTPDPAVLNEADVVIISRSVNSGNYSGASASAWNSLAAPMILMSGYTLRMNRMGFTTGNDMVDITGDITLTVSDPMHYIFNGVSLTGGTTDNPFAGVVTYPTDGTTLARGISINNNPAGAGGTVLATVSTAGGGPAGGMVIGEWQPGALVTHDGGAGTDTLGGPRLVFLSGSREAEGVSSETAGLFDLSPDGARMFVNAVRYAASRKGGVPAPPPVAPAFEGIALNADGTITVTWTGEGALQSAPTLTGQWEDVTGATSPYTAPAQGTRFFRLRAR